MLRNELAEEGDRLFRMRSLLPLLLLLPVATTLQNFRYLGGRAETQDAWSLVCLAISVGGLCLRGAVVSFVPSGTSGRDTLRQRADELNTTGCYSVCRNPLYLGNYLMMLGVALTSASVELAFICTAAWIIYYERIIAAEEAFLLKRFGRAFESWANRTPVIFPKLKLWARPSGRFDLRQLLRREYTGAGFVGTSFFLMHVAQEFVVCGRPAARPMWTCLFIVTSTTYLAVRTLKRWTTVLCRRRSERMPQLQASMFE